MPEDTLAWRRSAGLDEASLAVLLSPVWGVVVLMFLSWRPEQIRRVRVAGVELNNGTVMDPAGELGCQLEELRRRLAGHPGADSIDGRLVFLHLDRPTFTRLQLERAFPRDVVLTSEQLTPGALALSLRRLPIPWTSEQLSDCRARLHPETTFERLVPVRDRARGERELIRIHLAAEQEALARSLDTGCCLLRGIAGSGKTLVLVARARCLAQAHPDWKILLLCYNRPLVQVLQELLGPWCATVEVATFHSWASHQGVYLPFIDDHDRIREDAIRIRRAVELGTLAHTYDAILVDEGQDFRPSWYWLLYSALRPERGGMLVVLDSNQAIYRDPTALAILAAPEIVRLIRQAPTDPTAERALEQHLQWWARSPRVTAAPPKEVLTLFTPEVKVVELNAGYRNTEQIGRFAAHCALRLGIDKCNGTPQSLNTEAVFHTTGEKVQIVWCESWNHQAEFIAREVARLVRETDVQFGDVAVLFSLRRGAARRLVEAFEREKLPSTLVTRQNRGELDKQLRDDKVKLTTAHYAKGLEFSVVFFFAVEALRPGDPLEGFDEVHCQQVRLAYVAMTRAKDLLYLTFTKDNPLVRVAKELGAWCEFRAYPEDFG